MLGLRDFVGVAGGECDLVGVTGSLLAAAVPVDARDWLAVRVAERVRDGEAVAGGVWVDVCAGVLVGVRHTNPAPPQGVEVTVAVTVVVVWSVTVAVIVVVVSIVTVAVHVAVDVTVVVAVVVVSTVVVTVVVMVAVTVTYLTSAGLPVTSVGVPLGEGLTVGKAVAYAEREDNGVAVDIPEEEEVAEEDGVGEPDGVPVCAVPVTVCDGDVVGTAVGKGVREGLGVGVPVTAVGVPLGDGVPVGKVVGYAEREADGLVVAAPDGVAL